MSKGFVSFLFLLLLASLIVLSSEWPHSSALEDSSIRHLSLRRLEMETNVDTIIRDELYAGLRSNLPPETIKVNINQRILAYVNNFQHEHDDSFAYESGFSPLTQTSYLSLFNAPQTPQNLLTFHSASHVLVLPVSQTERYGEYSYTGGVFATTIFHTRIRSHDANTLFALPIGFRVCATTFQKDWPCVESVSHAHA